ncbi:TatD family hydrolase [Paenibacillus sp. FA6]|uniref:TatD family hydrolase n=1 Tax=Paenibacillus sp. FA6 TaxID=3413029 RepID=UPI003F658733
MNISTYTPIIDAHIHLDSYSGEQPLHLAELSNDGVSGVIAVSMNLQSSIRNLEIARLHPTLVHPAFGFHPEQQLPTSEEVAELLSWMKDHHHDMIAVGEVGLPYYSQLEAKETGQSFDQTPYIVLLEQFISFAAIYDKPIILHAVYEDAITACNLLEKHGVTRAHFHWFKGSADTVERMANNGYFISFTPDILYEAEIQELARLYPKEQVMAETDGPWPFEGPFSGQMTHPRMVSDVIETWSQIHDISVDAARKIIHSNTQRFYGI